MQNPERQLYLNFFTLDSFVSKPPAHGCLIKENSGMRGLTLWVSVQRGRWDALAKGWSGMCGISGDKPDASPCTTEYVLHNTFLLCKTQCNQARLCTSSPFQLHVYLACKRAGGMKGKGLGKLKGDGSSREGKGKFALSRNFYQRFSWVQLRVLGDTDTAETDSQTVRQTDNWEDRRDRRLRY